MNANRFRPSRPSAARRPRAWGVPAAVALATALALPVHAGISIPEEPLSTAFRVAPNILFILDDSGSMAWANINNQQVASVAGTNFTSNPDANGVSNGTSITPDSTGNNAMYMQSYATNGLYYNPAVTYQPWMGPDGNRLTGGTSYSAAYSDNQYVTYTPAGTNSGTVNLGANNKTFFVPQDPTNTSPAYLSNIANYYRYIITYGGGDIVRSTWGNPGAASTVPSGFPQNSQSANSGNWKYYTVTVPAGTTVLSVKTSGGNGNADLYVRPLINPTLSAYQCRSNGGNNTETCMIYRPTPGVYQIGVYAAADFANVTLAVRLSSGSRCDDGTATTGWVGCTSVLPSSRSLADELTNFATWYSYHRTRTKSAKAAAAEAFRTLGNRVRVGYRTIWDRNNFDIPVTDGNDGRFVNNDGSNGNPVTTSRSTWYNRLFAAIASNGTPLQAALNNAGQYFSRTDANGPYGPQSGAAQYTCRQNFTILTTDGYWNNAVVASGNQDNTAGSTITGPGQAPYTYTPSAPFADGYTNTLADVAMRYWKSDLRTDMTNNVPSSTADPAFWQHMVTFTISIGLKTTMGWGSVAEATAAINGGAVWPDPQTATPTTDDARRLDDLLHAAVNGHGEFTAATNPSEFSAGLAKALAAVVQRTSSFSNVATNAASIKTGGKVFNASYVSGLWTGQVKAWTLDANNNPNTLAWSATIPSYTTRKVFTWNGAMGATFPTTTQLLALTRVGGPVDFPVTGIDNANYLKGDASKEEKNGGLLRNRTSVLGDIIGSSPAYVDDTKTLYVGANDGMLHAFDGDTGNELFAYVPGLINIGNLRDLSRGDYTHKFFVDGPVVVSDRKLTPGQNILVGALGKGGKGLFALDVTNPGSFGASNALWERADTASGNMGLVMGRPVLARVKSGQKAVILGNGVNSTNDKAVLIVLDLATGAVLREIDTGAGNSSNPNGLAAPSVVLGPDGKTVAYAYAGDRLGNVWKFDLTSATPGAWTATKLFTARSNDGSGAVQPITGGVAVATDPKTFKRWVFVGTGSFLTTAEAEDKTPLTQSMYGFIDDDSGLPVAYTDLVKRNIGNTGAVVDGYPVRTFDAKADLPVGKKGWFVNLPGNGERIVQDAQVVANILVTASMIPEGDACESGGTGYINALDAFTGTSAGSSFFDLNNDGKTSDTVVGGVPVGSVNFGVGMPTLPIFLDGKLVVGGTGGSIGSEKPGAGGVVRKQWSRVSWREIRGD